MKRKGVSYDVGCVMGGSWRPDYDPRRVPRELEIIKQGLHCTAMRISGLDLDRLMTAAESALQQRLEVWLSPQLWNKSPELTLAYLTRAVERFEKLRTSYSDQVAFSVGSDPDMPWEPKESFWAMAAYYAADVVLAQKEAR